MRVIVHNAKPMVFVVILLTVHAGLLLGSLRKTFITVDEVGHVVAGISYWRTCDFRVYKVNPPLSKMLAVLPALTAHPALELNDLPDVPGLRHEFALGPKFSEANRPALFDLVCLSRLMGVIWSLAGAWLAFHWSRTLYGDAAGYLALVLWCFEPGLLGHAALVTADVPAAVAGLYASYAFWRYLKSPTLGRACLAGLLLGVGCLVKFTLMAFFALWPVLWLCGLQLRRGSPEVRRPLIGLAHIALILLVGLDVFNAGYGFSGSFRSLGDYEFVSRTLGGETTPGNRFRGPLGRLPVPLPSDAVRGIDEQRRDFESHWQSYLGGEWRNEGWWYYYMYAMAVKLPLGTLTLLLWGLVSAVFRRGVRTDALDEIVVLGTASAILALISSQTGFSHHSRYALPALPYLIINASRLASDRVGSRRWVRASALALAIWGVASSLVVYPHSLSYFNEAAGGPDNGHAHLLDSNIDWGQDLLFLRDWLREHPEARPLGAAYFNVLDPGIADIDCTLAPPGPPNFPPTGPIDWAKVGPLPGYYAVSVNFLRGFQFFIQDSHGNRRTVGPHELEYFRRFQPIGRAGYSIYIYRITSQEADAVRRDLKIPPITGRPGGRDPFGPSPQSVQGEPESR